MSDWAFSLPDMLDQVWQRLGRGVADAKAPARLPVLATVSPEGWPEARTVVLRAATRSEGTCEVHTDLTSDKMASLSAAPRAALHIWEPRAQLQMRLAARVQVLSGAGAAGRWARVPDASRAGYGKHPVPGTPIPGPLDYETRSDPAAFAVLILTLDRIEALHLGPQHSRALYLREDGWQGRWLSP